MNNIEKQPKTVHQSMGWFVLAFLLSMYLFSSILTFLIPDFAGVEFVMLAEATVLTVALPMILYLSMKRVKVLYQFRLQPISLKLALFMVAFGVCTHAVNMLMSIPLNALLINVDFLMPPNVPSGTNLYTYLLSLGCVAVVPALFEELFFRGMLLREYEAYGARKAIIVTSLTFAMLHGNIYSLGFTMILGVLCAIVTVRTNSVISGMIVHFTVNATSLTLEYIRNMDFFTANTEVASLVMLAYIAVFSLAFVFLYLRFIKSTKMPEPTRTPCNIGEATEPKLGVSAGYIVTLVLVVLTQASIILSNLAVMLK